MRSAIQVPPAAEWIWHGAAVTVALAAGLQPQSLAGSWDSAAALACAVLLIAVEIDQARRTQNPLWIYGVALLAGLAGVYLRRLRWVGLAPPSVWDTAALMGAAYGLFILQRLPLLPACPPSGHGATAVGLGDGALAVR